MKIILKSNQLIDGTGSDPIKKSKVVIEKDKIISNVSIKILILSIVLLLN